MPWQRQQYAAWVATMDDCVGEILGKLDQLKLREKTLVIWLPDHGHSTEARANYGGGNAGPYRGCKFTVWEGGIRVPCIVSCPGRIPQGEVRAQMATSLDWLPTICDYCGARLPRRKIDGKSIRPVIESADAKSPHDVFHWQSGRMWAVRSGDWKLVTEMNRKSQQPSLLLSNLAEDVTETKSLAKQHPEIVKELTELHKKWAAEVKP
jgi:arylsulfatase A